MRTQDPQDNPWEDPLVVAAALRKALPPELLPPHLRDGQKRCAICGEPVVL